MDDFSKRKQADKSMNVLVNEMSPGQHTDNMRVNADLDEPMGDSLLK